MDHAFFKALMFLAAGSVIHALHHKSDVWEMGGLIKKMPITGWTFVIGGLAIAGIPPLRDFGPRMNPIGYLAVCYPRT
ncbi:hypothetical protein N752_23405 [Desulforamulus aquiferis]|nr:hypothetical protein N752_23405 [Desulforamulus aquiferis]